jgi:hypothetical protein
MKRQKERSGTQPIAESLKFRSAELKKRHSLLLALRLGGELRLVAAWPMRVKLRFGAQFTWLFLLFSTKKQRVFVLHQPFHLVPLHNLHRFG